MSESQVLEKEEIEEESPKNIYSALGDDIIEKADKLSQFASRWKRLGEYLQKVFCCLEKDTYNYEMVVGTRDAIKFEYSKLSEMKVEHNIEVDLHVDELLPAIISLLDKKVEALSVHKEVQTLFEEMMSSIGFSIESKQQSLVLAEKLREFLQTRDVLLATAAKKEKDTKETWDEDTKLMTFTQFLGYRPGVSVKDTLEHVLRIGERRFKIDEYEEIDMTMVTDLLNIKIEHQPGTLVYLEKPVQLTQGSNIHESFVLIVNANIIVYPTKITELKPNNNMISLNSSYEIMEELTQHNQGSLFKPMMMSVEVPMAMP